jgi:hypothetical protein
MFSNNVTLKLKLNSAPEFARIVENEIIPLLRNHTGFREEISFVAPARSQAEIISLWDNKADEELYSRTGYPAVLKVLSKVMEGTPTVETFELSTSTFPKIAAQKA